jgi:hypothetical protein
MKWDDIDARVAKRLRGFFYMARRDETVIGDKERAMESQLARHLAEAAYRALSEYDSGLWMKIE